MTPDLFGEAPEKLTRYNAKAVSEGTQMAKPNRTPNQEFVHFYMTQVYNVRGIDYILPKGRLRKYYSRAKDIIETLGDIKTTKKYISWFMNSDSFASAQWNIDLLVSTPVLNKFLAAKPQDTKVGITDNKVNDKEGREALDGRRVGLKTTPWKEVRGKRI
jgi:hypothetical protein